MAGDDDEMFMTRSFSVTLKATEQHLIARSDKSVAYVTNTLSLQAQNLPFQQILPTLDFCYLRDNGTGPDL